jgi:hypothetical protein
MKKLTTLLFFLSVFAATAQTFRIDTIITNQRDSSVYPCATVVKHLADTSYKTVYIADTIFRALYINSLDQIVGNVAKENALIADLKKYKITTTYAYGAGTNNVTGLSNLNRRIRRETSCQDIGATAGNGATFLGARTTYNKSVPDSSDFSNWNLEYEAYNQNDVASAWSTNIIYLRQMQSGKAAAKVKDDVQYFGWWTKPPMNVQTPDSLVKYTDYGVLHEYTTVPQFAYMKQRCTDLNAAAKRQNKVWRVRVLFSAEPAFLQNWLRAGHSLDEAFKIVYSGFKAMNYSNLIMDGYIVFHLDFLRASQPITNGLFSVPVRYSNTDFINQTTKEHLQLAVPPDSE